MRRSLPFVLLSLVTLLAGCFCQEMVTHVTWLPDTSQFQVERQILNIQKDGLDCADVESCVEKVKAFVADPSEFDDVIGAMAEDVQVSLSRQGARLDAMVRWTTPAGSQVVPGTGVFVEEEGRKGKEKPHLLVFLGGDSEDVATRTTVVEVDGKVRRRLIWFADREDTPARRYEVWSLPRKVHTVTLRSTYAPEARPLFQDLPGLAEALVGAGLLPAEP
ncbi:MAG: hypothetical protein JXB39_16810 [Deltaproteobacteria bacterium]|nr:hypothetical protein [Deltaproteobacteria bacterium]